MPHMPEERSPPADDAPARDRQWIHDLRNAVNAAGLCVHAAEQLLLAGHTGKALDTLEGAARSLKRLRDLLATPTDAA